VRALHTSTGVASEITKCVATLAVALALSTRSADGHVPPPPKPNHNDARAKHPPARSTLHDDDQDLLRALQELPSLYSKVTTGLQKATPLGPGPDAIARWVVDTVTQANAYHHRARITGQILDASGHPLSGARISLRSANGHTFFFASSKHATRSAPNGSFFMSKIDPGTYQIYVTISGKHTTTRATLRPNESHSLTLTL
jgi:hypothetical protein